MGTGHDISEDQTRASVIFGVADSLRFFEVLGCMFICVRLCLSMRAEKRKPEDALVTASPLLRPLSKPGQTRGKTAATLLARILYRRPTNGWFTIGRHQCSSNSAAVQLLRVTWLRFSGSFWINGWSSNRRRTGERSNVEHFSEFQHVSERLENLVAERARRRNRLTPSVPHVTVLPQNERPTKSHNSWTARKHAPIGLEPTNKVVRGEKQHFPSLHQ